MKINNTLHMKRILTILFVMTSITVCHAQFGALGKIYQGAKAAKQAQKAAKATKKSNDAYQGYAIDTTSVEYKKALEEAKQRAKAYEKSGYGKQYENAQSGGQTYSSFTDDPVFKKIMNEKRQPTIDEANYLNSKYGTSFEGAGMEAYNDSIGVFARIEGRMKPMGITKCERITDDRPVPDFGQDAIKQYVKDWLSVLKKPFADREVVDSVQNYMIYKNRHADEQFNGVAKFTIYSNPELGTKRSKDDLLRRKLADFTDPVDPNNIFVFKVNKGIDCRFMDYMYTKITYKQSELMDYVSKRLVNDGYIDANINQKMSDDQLFKAIDKLEFLFKVEKLLKLRQNKDKYMFTNAVPAAKGVKVKTSVRKVGQGTALEVSIDAEPGEYAFVIRDPEVEKEIQQQASFDISVLSQGAFFFTVN